MNNDDNFSKREGKIHTNEGIFSRKFNNEERFR